MAPFEKMSLEMKKPRGFSASFMAGTIPLKEPVRTMEVKGFDQEIDYNYVTEVDNNLQCPICRNPFVLPMMSPVCEHIFCQHCLTRALALSPSCPVDRSPLHLSDVIPAPRIIQIMVKELRVACPNKLAGCDYECERGLLATHLKEDCARERMDRSGKGKQVLVEMVDDDDNITMCELCQERMNESLLHSHQTTCMSLPVECPYCSESMIRATLPSHLLSTCSLVPTPCPHSIHGCTSLIPRDLIQEHLELTCPFEPLKQFFGRYEDRIGVVEGDNWELKKKVEILESEMKEMRGVLDAVRKGMGDYYVGPSTSPSAVPIPAAASTQTILSNDESRRHPSPSPPLPSMSPTTTQSLRLTVDTTPVTTITQPPSLARQISLMSTSLTNLTASLTSVDNRLSTSLSTETMRLQEEIGLLRGSMHQSRMQSHFVLQEVNRMTEGLNFLSSQSGMNHLGMGGGRRDDGGGSDDDELPRFFGAQPPPFNSQPPPQMFGMSGAQNGFRNAAPLSPSLLNHNNMNNNFNGGFFPGNGLMMGGGTTNGGMMRPRRFSQQQETKL